MRKILLMFLIVMASMISAAFAYSDESNADAQKVFDSIREIRYNVEAGVNFQDYSSLVSKAIVNLNKYKDKYLSSDKDLLFETNFKKALSSYVDARTVWGDAIYNDGNVIFRSDLEKLINLHPTLKNKLPKTDNDHVCVGYEDVLQALWSVAADDEKSIADISTKK